MKTAFRKHVEKVAGQEATFVWVDRRKGYWRAKFYFYDSLFYAELDLLRAIPEVISVETFVAFPIGSGSGGGGYHALSINLSKPTKQIILP